MAELVTIDTDNGVADVRLNRADKYNALSGEMFQAIIDAGAEKYAADNNIERRPCDANNNDDDFDL